MNPIVRMMKRYINMPLKFALPLLFIGALVLVSISGCTSSNNAVTASPTAATSAMSTTTPTATPTATPTSVPISVLLAEQPASAGGPDLSAELNKNMAPMTFHRVTIDGHDAYAEATGKQYVFPFSSYSDAQALQASLVAKFKANGFTAYSETQDPWGPYSILTGLKSGTSSVTISAADSATVTPLTNALDTGSEVDVIVFHK
jgi:hypothetical protein